MILEWLRQAGENDIMWIAILAGALAQFLKPVTFWWRTKEWDWHHIANTGGMPSSHSALVSALGMGLGITQGFNSPIFALALIFCMIVVYDAQGVRRQAGEHAIAINEIIAELLSGHELQEKHFQEVLGHSKMEATGGVIFGIAVMVLWKFAIQRLFLG